jgi:hypothetical protein
MRSRVMKKKLLGEKYFQALSAIRSRIANTGRFFSQVLVTTVVIIFANRGSGKGVRYREKVFV